MTRGRREMRLDRMSFVSHLGTALVVECSTTSRFCALMVRPTLRHFVLRLLLRSAGRGTEPLKTQALSAGMAKRRCNGLVGCRAWTRTPEQKARRDEQ